jgi:16S rRNA (adenine1518-N6/adenine1519-N6)-dimethyltransferase
MSQFLREYYQISAKKKLGQNFLTDENKLQIIAQAHPLAGKNVIEVWPGYGALTEYILQEHPTSLDLVELDRDMIAILEDRLDPASTYPLVAEWSTVQILHQDVLKLEQIPEKSIIVANIPYYITSPILTHFLMHLHSHVDAMVIMMQREVAEKILAKKWKHSYLSISCHLFCSEISLVTNVPASSFVPAPKVDSSVLLFTTAGLNNEELIYKQKILQLASHGFREPRKKLVSNLAKYGSYDKWDIISLFEKLDLSENLRAEDLSTENWNNLYRELTSK